MQQAGITIIPTAGFADESSWEWCFDGLPINSTVAVTTDYALQQAGITIIPTAGFADESSWEWCFDGLPINSTVAVTTNCLGRDRETHRLFVGGINAMVKKIHPTAIVVCGKVPAWLEKNFSRHQNRAHSRLQRNVARKGAKITGGYGGSTAPDG